MAVIAIAVVAIILFFRRRNTNAGGAGNDKEMKYSPVATQSIAAQPSASYAPTMSTNNPFASTSATNTTYTMASVISDPYNQAPINMSSPTALPNNPYLTTAAAPLVNAYTPTPLQSNSYNLTPSPNNLHTAAAPSTSHLSIPASSMSGSQRVDTPSTAYFDTSTTIQGHGQSGANASASTFDAHAPPSFVSSSSDSPVNVGPSGESQVQLTGEQIDFVTSLQKANVPHTEILAVMERMRGQAAGGSEGDGMSAPPVYDFKSK